MPYPAAMPYPTPSASAVTMLLVQHPPAVPSPAEVMTMTVELPPGDSGTPPHRHSGPVFGYLLEGEMTSELEGEPERVIGAGEAFWEPGGDVIQGSGWLHALVPRAAHDDSVLAGLRSHLGEAAFEQAWAQGGALAGRRAVAYARNEADPGPADPLP